MKHVLMILISLIVTGCGPTGCGPTCEELGGHLVSTRTDVWMPIGDVWMPVPITVYHCVGARPK